MIFYIFLVAVLNLALGFALAVYLGRRCRRAASLGELSLSLLANGLAAGNMPATGSQQATAIASSIQQLQSEVESYYGQLTETDDKLRENADSPDTAAIQQCLDSLQTTTQQYRQQSQAAIANFAEQHQGRPELSPLLTRMQEALEQETATIETAHKDIAGFDYQADLKAGCRQILAHTAKLVGATHRVRDSLDETGIAVDSDQSGTGVSCANGLELALAEWWKDDPHHARQLAAALLDVDQFERINEQYGPKAGDRILQAVGQVLHSQQRGECFLARAYGQRFFVLFPDTDIHDATNAAERIRQTIENTQFEYHEQGIRLTISCAVAEAAVSDTPRALCQRAEAVLREAKRYGRNRTFAYEGEYLPLSPRPIFPWKRNPCRYRAWVLGLRAWENTGFSGV